MAEPKLQAPPALPVYYMKMLDNQSDARLGKLKSGQVVPMDEARATRFLTAGIAEQASKGEYDQQQGRRSDKAQATRNAFQAQQDGHALWDVSTYRDVLTAPEGGLRLAHERGIPLINIHMLRDEDGDPLPPDADIEDILDARQLMHPDLVAPFAAHDRSSVQGGGSIYQSNVNPGGPMPLSPQHRATMERIAAAEATANRPVVYGGTNPVSLDNDADSPPPVEPNYERTNRATRRTQAREAVKPTPPAPPISPAAAATAEDNGVVAPSNELTPEQRA